MQEDECRRLLEALLRDSGVQWVDKKAQHTQDQRHYNQ